MRRLRVFSPPTATVLVAFYCGTGVACAWAYRKAVFKDVRFFFSGGLLPLLSGGFCFWVGDRVIAQSGWSGAAPVLLTMLLGVPLALLAQRVTKTEFFQRPLVAYDTIG